MSLDKIYKPLGASNHVPEERAEHDYYATSPAAVEALVNVAGDEISEKIWEPACGGGHLSEKLQELGYTVYSSDLIDHGYGETGIDFLATDMVWDGDILTNPRYVQRYGVCLV